MVNGFCARKGKTIEFRIMKNGIKNIQSNKAAAVRRN